MLTQNFKAEYEKASSAAITAVTKSGGNAWTGDVFLLYQDKNLVAQDTSPRSAARRSRRTSASRAA